MLLVVAVEQVQEKDGQGEGAEEDEYEGGDLREMEADGVGVDDDAEEAGEPYQCRQNHAEAKGRE